MGISYSILLINKLKSIIIIKIINFNPTTSPYELGWPAVNDLDITLPRPHP